MTLGSYLLFAAGSAAGAGLAWAVVRQPVLGFGLRWILAGLAAGVLSYLLFAPAAAGSEAAMQTKTEVSLRSDLLDRIDRGLALWQQTAAALASAVPVLARIATALEAGGMTAADEDEVAGELDAATAGLVAGTTKLAPTLTGDAAMTTPNQSSPKVGAIPPQIAASVQKLQSAVGDAATAMTNAGTTITTLRAQVKTGMTDAEVAQLQGQLDAVSGQLTQAGTQLNAVAADPNVTPPAPTP